MDATGASVRGCSKLMEEAQKLYDQPKGATAARTANPLASVDNAMARLTKSRATLTEVMQPYRSVPQEARDGLGYHRR